MAYTPPPEMQKVMDATRDSYRRQFEKSDQTQDELLAEIWKQGMRVNWMTEDDDGMWRAYLRYRENNRLAYSGYGADISEALFHALKGARDGGYKDRDLPPPAAHEMPGSALSGARKSTYGSPALRETPDEDPPWTGDAGAPVDDDAFEEIEAPGLSAEDVL